MSSTTDLTEGAGLQQWIVMSKNAKGKALTALIGQMLGANNVFVFGEILDLPQVNQLEGEDKAYVELLKIFAYGTYGDFKANSSKLPALSAPQLKKLRQLTIVSLAGQTKDITYDTLLKQLDISDLRELEDLIIDAIYQGIIQGKLDQKRKLIHIETSMGRDLRPESVDEMIRVLNHWAKHSESLLKNIKEKISHATMMYDIEKKEREEFEKKIEAAKQNLKIAMEAEMLQGIDMDDPDGERRKGRKGKGKGFEDRHPGLKHK